jgi:hypothetical protein
MYKEQFVHNMSVSLLFIFPYIFSHLDPQTH